jgi:hypothetical protein
MRLLLKAKEIGSLMKFVKKTFPSPQPQTESKFDMEKLLQDTKTEGSVKITKKIDDTNSLELSIEFTE